MTGLVNTSTSAVDLEAAGRRDRANLGGPAANLPAGVKARAKAPACPAQPRLSSEVNAGPLSGGPADPYVADPDIPRGVTCEEWRKAHPPLPRSGLVRWLRHQMRPVRG